MAVKLVPLLCFIGLGYVLKGRLLDDDDGRKFLALVFYITLPALLVVSIPRVKLAWSMVKMPLIAMVIILVSWPLAHLAGKAMKLPRPTFGTFLAGSMIINTAFILPFVVAAYGDDGLARAASFDFGNGLLVLTLVYGLTCKYGGDGSAKKHLLRKLALAPPLWALMIGFTLNGAGIQVPVVLAGCLEMVGSLTVPLLMLSVGLFFTVKITRAAPVLWAIVIRMAVGFLLGNILVIIFKLQGLDRAVVLLESVSPVGYCTLTFSSLENCDTDLAAAMVSCSIPLGIITASLLVMFL